ncbi:hypothetical protein KAW48_01835 [candidate division WOR-3 bacterium]|nr:hypothetical protein [candidate division WOR-3 bacterium]
MGRLLIFWFVPAFFFLAGLTFFFFPDFWIKLNAPNLFTRTEKLWKFARVILRYFGGLLSSSVSYGITTTYGQELLRIDHLYNLPFEVKIMSASIASLIVIAGMICFHYSHYFMHVVKNLAEMITNDEEKALNAHEKATIIFRIFSIFVILFAPFWGILDVMRMYK